MQGLSQVFFDFRTRLGWGRWGFSLAHSRRVFRRRR